MSQNYNILVTSGTSPGPYTIYFSQTGSTNYIATLYGTSNPASGLTINDMTSGVQIEVPDGVYVLYVVNEYCNTSKSIYVSALPEEYNICLTVSDADFTQIHFIPNSLYNGHESWISDDSTYQLIWDNTLNKWTVIGGSLPYTLLSTAPYPPTTGWYTVGQTTPSVLSNSGACPDPETIIDFTMSINQPSCGCNGSLTLIPASGTAPYQFSIDNGVTFGNQTIFTNLCAGSYSIIMKDSNNNLSFTQTAILNPSPAPTVYTMTVNKTTTVLSSSPISITKETVAIVTITPALPVGTTIDFSISHFNNFDSSPQQNTANLITNTVLTKNTLPITKTSTNSSNSTATNTINGCQSNLVYKTSTTDIWNNITMDNTSVVKLTTVTTVSSGSSSPCKIVTADDTYQITNAKITGCSCCTINYN